MRDRRILIAVCCAAVTMLALPAGSPAASYVDGQVIVKYRSGTTVAERLALFDRAGVTRTVGKVSGVGASVVAVTGDAADAAARLSRSSHVVYAEPNYILRASATPNDPLFADMYGLHNTGQTGGSPDADIDAPEGWDAFAGFPATGGARVGIVDTGIDRAHPDLAGKVADADCAESRGFLGIFAGQIRTGRCSDDNGHGTHVAGTISANTNNAQGVAGVSFNSPLIICRALGGPAGTGNTADVANCITWTAQRGAKIISMSLGGGDSSTLRSAVQNAWNNGNGALLVAAAGNDGNSTVNYPAGYAEVVSVAATDDRDRRASFSNANADVEVAAPGVDILSTYLGGGYTELSGTSMATPHAAGVAGVISTLNPSANAATLRSRLQAAVDDLGPAGRDSSFGFGRVNLCKARGGSCAYTGGG